MRRRTKLFYAIAHVIYCMQLERQYELAIER